MKIARMLITPELLRELVHMPVLTRIVDAGWNRGCVELTIEHPDLKDVTLSEAELPPLASPLFRNNPPVELIGWGQD